MSGRRSERSIKSVNYSKFSNDGNQSADDDDFMEDTPPMKRSRKNEKKTKDHEKVKISEKKEAKPLERKARNRLSAEEKYEQELEIALKMSLGGRGEGAVTCNSSDSSQPETETPAKSCTVEADVLNSPNSKQNSTENSPSETRRNPVANGATVKSEDRIVSEPKEDTTRRKSGRTKRIKEREEDEYEMSNDEESESDEDLSAEDESDMSDYEETPKRKPKMKKPAQKKEPKVKVKGNNATLKPSVQQPAPKKASVAAHTPVRKTSSKENKPSAQKSTAFKPLHQINPSTPKSTCSLLPRRSPFLATNKQGKFIQPGWTPPGPAGSKTNSLKSPQSPGYIRVGLSRNIKLAPLHPHLNLK